MMTSGLQRREPNTIQRLWRETSGELRKVSWPTRQEAIGLTQVVLFVMFITAVLLGGLDWVFFRFFGWLLAR